MEMPDYYMTLSHLKQDHWRRLAGRIDSGFFDSEKTFSVERKKGYYLLTTNRCDDCSVIRVYCEVGAPGFSKIERIGPDTNDYQEIHPGTYQNVIKFLKDEIC